MQKIFATLIKWIGLPLLKELGSLLVSLIKEKIEKQRRKKQEKEELKKAEDYEKPDSTIDDFNNLP